jgi:hypothetical protein
MPIEIMELEAQTLTVRAYGDVTLDECRQYQKQLLADPRMRSGIHLLADLTGVTGAPSAAELRTVAREFQPLIEKGLGRIALLSDSTFMYGVARMFCVFAESVGMTVAVFRDRAEAQEWLDSQTTPVA